MDAVTLEVYNMQVHLIGGFDDASAEVRPRPFLLFHFHRDSESFRG